MRVLVVEDHRAMRDIVSGHLRDRGFAVDAFESGDDAFAAVSTIAYDALILDIGLPGMDGMTVLRRLRAGPGTDLPTLIVTARDAVEDRVEGLNAGADDYVLKPFDLIELEARLRAVLRRPGRRGETTYRYGDLSFDTHSRRAAVGVAELELTRREVSVLEELIRAGGRIVVKDALEDRLYGFNEEVGGNALEAAVSRLRRKLAEGGSNVRIGTSRGIGYRLQEEDR